MQFKTELIILGAKSSKGDFNGKPYDSTTVFYQADLQSGENFVGQVGDQLNGVHRSILSVLSICLTHLLVLPQWNKCLTGNHRF